MTKQLRKLEKTRYFSPTPIDWRIVGDVCLILIPIVDGIIAAAPDLSEGKRYWLAAGLNIALVVVKFLTNLPKNKQ